jgi:hypothetical protein
VKKKEFHHILKIGDLYDGEKENHASKVETRIEFYYRKKKIEFGKNIPIKGYLEVGDNIGLENAPIELYFNDDFVNTVITNDKGIFKAFIPNEVPGHHDIRLFFRGNWQYESCEISKPVPYKGLPEKSQSKAGGFVGELVALADLYERGLLSDDEFKAFKEKLLK